MLSALPSSYRFPLVGLALLGLLSFFPLIWVILGNTDAAQRNGLVFQSEVAAKAIDASIIKELKGEEADLYDPSYLKLKEQLKLIRTARPDYRFVYLMGRRADNTVFFFADSEDETSKDYSPPGQVYKSPSKQLVQLFTKRIAFVEGPLQDDWGTWVSALSPVYDPKTHEIIAVLGIDVAAETWHNDILAQALPSIGFMLLLLVCVVGWFILSLRRVLSRF